MSVTTFVGHGMETADAQVFHHRRTGFVNRAPVVDERTTTFVAHIEVATHGLNPLDAGAFGAAHLGGVQHRSRNGRLLRGALFIFRLFNGLRFNIRHYFLLFRLPVTQTPVNADGRIRRNGHQRHFKNFPIGRPPDVFRRLVVRKHAVSARHVHQNAVFHQLKRPVAFFRFGKAGRHVGAVFVLFHLFNNAQEPIPVVVKKKRHRPLPLPGAHRPRCMAQNFVAEIHRHRRIRHHRKPHRTVFLIHRAVGRSQRSVKKAVFLFLRHCFLQ